MRAVRNPALALWQGRLGWKIHNRRSEERWRRNQARRRSPAGKARRARRDGRATSNTVKAAPARLSLFGLLNYLWEEAGLCEMHPHYKGRRFWGVVSNRLNAALSGKTTKTFSYDHIAYIPAQFDPADPAANGRAQLAKTHRAIGDRHRMMFIGEFKELTQGKFGPVLKLKHVDCAITVADDLKRRMQSRFKAEFAACTEPTAVLTSSRVVWSISTKPATRRSPKSAFSLFRPNGFRSHRKQRRC